MPKQKSHSGTKKRFWLTGSGKVNRPHGGQEPQSRNQDQQEKKKSSSVYPRFHNAGKDGEEHDTVQGLIRREKHAY